MLDWGGWAVGAAILLGLLANALRMRRKPASAQPEEPGETWYWISFVARDPERKFAGCAIVGPARDGGHAVELAVRHGCAPPNAECETQPTPEITRVALRDTFRLLSLDEARDVFGAADVRRLLAKFSCMVHGDGCATHAANEVDNLRECKLALDVLLAEHPEARAWVPGWVRPRLDKASDASVD